MRIIIIVYKPGIQKAYERFYEYNSVIIPRKHETMKIDSVVTYTVNKVEHVIYDGELMAVKVYIS